MGFHGSMPAAAGSNEALALLRLTSNLRQRHIARRRQKYVHFIQYGQYTGIHALEVHSSLLPRQSDLVDWRCSMAVAERDFLTASLASGFHCSYPCGALPGRRKQLLYCVRRPWHRDMLY